MGAPVTALTMGSEAQVGLWAVLVVVLMAAMLMLGYLWGQR